MGNIVFYTGNRYAARSIDGGQTWKYVNPFKDMGDEKVKFADANNNDKWDYRDDGTIETIIYDHNNNDFFDTSDERLNGTAIQQGYSLEYSDLISFTDVNNNDVFDSGETLVYDANGNLSYDWEDTHLAGPAPPRNLEAVLKPDFCCDQDVIYIPAWSIFVWIRQGFSPDDVEGSNRFRVGVSTDSLAWQFSDIRPTNVNSTLFSPDLYFDFPILAFSNNYLYITTTVCCDYFERSIYGVVIETFQRFYTTILKIQIDLLKESPLSLVRAGRFQGQSYTEYRDTDIPDDLADFEARELERFAPVQGATSIMYWGTHIGDSVIRLFQWPETGMITWRDVVIPSYSNTLRGEARCPSVITGGNRTDPCHRTDDRIRGGWVANGVIGFLWNAKQDVTQGPDCCRYPYVNVVRIKQESNSFLDNPRLSSNQLAVIYGSASPNLRGDLGVVAFTTGGVQGDQQYPALVVGTQDVLNPAPLQLGDFTAVARSTDGPETDEWGDYIRVRPYSGTGNAWVGTGFTLQGGSTDNDVEPMYFVFGRSSDSTFDETVSPSWTTQATLSATDINGGVRLTWAGAVDNIGVAGYWLYREDSLHQNVTLIATIQSSSRTADVSGLRDGQTYVFRVTAFDPAGNLAAGPSITFCVGCLLAFLPFAIAGTIVAANWIGGGIAYAYGQRRSRLHQPKLLSRCSNCGGAMEPGLPCAYCGSQPTASTSPTS